MRNGAGIDVSGTVPVTFADYGIATPDIANFVIVQPIGDVEFLLTLAAAGHAKRC